MIHKSETETLAGFKTLRYDQEASQLKFIRSAQLEPGALCCVQPNRRLVRRMLNPII